MAVEKEPLMSRTKRNINFYPTCTIVLIPSRNEYKAAGLYSCLWWSTDDYFGFQQSAISEVRMLVHGKNIAVKAAKRILYQPNEDDELNNDIIEESMTLTEVSDNNNNNNNNNNNSDDESVPMVPNTSRGVSSLSSISVTSLSSNSSNSNSANNNVDDADDSFFVGGEIDDNVDNDENIVTMASTHSEQVEETVELNKKLSRVSSLECIDTSKLKRTLAQSTSYMNLNNNEESMTNYDCLCLCVPLPQGSNIIFDRKKRHMASAFAPFHGPITVLLLIVVALLLVDKIL